MSPKNQRGARSAPHSTPSRLRRVHGPELDKHGMHGSLPGVKPGWIFPAGRHFDRLVQRVTGRRRAVGR
jgi:hypothetical protein